MFNNIHIKNKLIKIIIKLTGISLNSQNLIKNIKIHIFLIKDGKLNLSNEIIIKKS